MTVTIIGPSRRRVGSVAGPGLRAVLRPIDCDPALSVERGLWVRAPGISGYFSPPGWAWIAMRERMFRRPPNLVEGTP